VYDRSHCESCAVRTRVNSPGGVAWTVRTYRVRLPPWRQIDLGGDGEPQDAVGLLFSVVASLVAIVAAVLIAVVELPVAVVRGFASRDAWVEAETVFPVEEHFLWRTSRTDAPTVHAAVAAQLSTGEPLQPKRAQLVEHG
jgi:hypothetical protein